LYKCAYGAQRAVTAINRPILRRVRTFGVVSNGLVIGLAVPERGVEEFASSCHASAGVAANSEVRNSIRVSTTRVTVARPMRAVSVTV
jgi:hypothetical protein